MEMFCYILATIAPAVPTALCREALTTTESRDLLLCCVFVFRHAPQESLAALWHQCTTRQLCDMAYLLE